MSAPYPPTVACDCGCTVPIEQGLTKCSRKDCDCAGCPDCMDKCFICGKRYCDDDLVRRYEIDGMEHIKQADVCMDCIQVMETGEEYLASNPEPALVAA